MFCYVGIFVVEVISSIQDVYKGNSQFKDVVIVVQIFKVYEIKIVIWSDYDIGIICISVDCLFG